MIIEPVELGLEKQLWEVFYSSVYQTCVSDYSLEQIQVWAPDQFSEATRLNRVTEINPFVAVLDNKVVGYADVQSDGYIDHFFVHGDYQSMGIGKALMEHLICLCLDQIAMHSMVSITAKPFFQKYGFYTVRKNTAKISCVELINFVMKRPAF